MGKEVEIHLEFSNGEKWSVPARIIADNRAKYYAEKDKDTTYDEEFKFTMGNNYELVDWMKNNMNWKDIKPHAKQIEGPVIEYEDEFCNCETNVVR